MSNVQRIKGLRHEAGRGFVTCNVVAFATLWFGAPAQCSAADVWGGSFSATNDYMIRGISRSDHQAAAQFDLHYLSSDGLIAGVNLASAHVTPGAGREAELSAFLGFAWRPREDWQAKVLASHYAYPGSGSRYDYDEVAIDTALRQWLDMSLVYSPNYPRFVSYRGLVKVSDTAAEVNFQLPLQARLSAIGGVGYSYLGGPDPADEADAGSRWAATVIWHF